jgi:chromosome segregation ATPase
MEDLLDQSEDRRQNLQHYFLQASLSKPLLELASSQRRNSELSRQVATLEMESAMLEKKCGTVDDLKLKIVTLAGKVRDFHKLQTQLDHVTSERDVLELDLVQRQSKLNQQAIKCDDLECQVEQLTTICDDLLKDVKLHEDRADKLEREIVETRKVSHRAGRGRSRPPRTIQAKQSLDSGSTESTDTDNDSSTLDPEAENNVKVVDSPGKAETVDLSTSRDDTIYLPGDVDTSRISIFEDDEYSAILREGPDPAMIENLVAKIGTLDQENAELVQSKQDMSGKFHALLQENALQSSRIKELELRLQHNQSEQQNETAVPTEPTPPSSLEKQPGRGYFLKRLLHVENAQQLKKMLKGGGGAADSEPKQ